jgi:hypothetical protein
MCHDVRTGFHFVFLCPLMGRKLGVGCHLLRQRNCVRRYRVYVGSSICEINLAILSDLIYVIVDHGTHTGTVGGS